MNYTEMESMLNEMMQDPMYQRIFWISLIVTYSITIAIGIAMYLLRAVAVRRISRSAGLSHPAYAFLPILRWVQLGRLAEMPLPFDRKPRKVLAFSVHLPILMTLSTILNLVYSTYAMYFMLIVPEQMPTDRLAGIMEGVSTAYSVVGMIATVFLMLALIRIFILIGHSSMIMPILGAMVPVFLSVFLFVYRKNDLLTPPDPDDKDPDDNGFYYDNQ